jgi:hypothetical protein
MPRRSRCRKRAPTVVELLSTNYGAAGSLPGWLGPPALTSRPQCTTGYGIIAGR